MEQSWRGRFGVDRIVELSLLAFCLLLQRDGSSLASDSGFYGSRVFIAATPKTSIAPSQRNIRVRAVMAPPQLHQRSPASTGAVSV